MFDKIFAALAAKGGRPDQLTIDATYLKAHRTAASSSTRGGAAQGSAMRSIVGEAVEGVPRRIGRTNGGLNSKLHAVCDGKGRPLAMLLSEGQMSDYTK